MTRPDLARELNKMDTITEATKKLVLLAYDEGVKAGPPKRDFNFNPPV